MGDDLHSYLAALRGWVFPVENLAHFVTLGETTLNKLLLKFKG
jgi:hypothetical protein